MRIFKRNVPSCISYTIPLVCNYPNRLPCGMWTVVVVVSLLWLLVKFFVLYVIFYYISLSYVRGGIVRTFKGFMHVRSKVVRTYVQGCYGRTCRECLAVRPKDLWMTVNENWKEMNGIWFEWTVDEQEWTCRFVTGDELSWADYFIQYLVKQSIKEKSLLVFMSNSEKIYLLCRRSISSLKSRSVVHIVAWGQILCYKM